MVGLARADEPRHIHVLSSGDRGRETVLVDALRIYTRDLGRTVTTGGAAPSSLEPAEIEKLSTAARAAGDEVLVWFGRERPVLYALRPDAAAGELRETAIEPGDPLSTARTLALKVRALIAPHVDEAVWAIPPELDASAQTEAASVSTEEMPPPLPPPPPEPVKPEPIKPPPVVTVAAAAPKPRRIWLEATASYGFTTPTDGRWLRHGFDVRLAVPLGRRLAISAQASFFVADPSATVGTSTVSARVWPVAIALSARLRRPRWLLEGGPRASLQILDVDAKDGDRSASARRYSAGLGGFVSIAWLFSRHAALAASFSVEALVPRQQLFSGGGATDLGYVQFSLDGGFLFSIP